MSRHRGEGARNARISIETQTKARPRPPAANTDKVNKGGDPDLGDRSPPGGTPSGRSPLGKIIIDFIMIIAEIIFCNIRLSRGFHIVWL